MHIVSGRDFSEADRVGASGVVIVNQIMARTYWGTQHVVGKRMSFTRLEGKPVWLDIVGVVNDTRDIALTEAPASAFFLPILQNQGGFEKDPLTLYLRTTGDPLPLASAGRKQIWAVDPDQPIAEIST
jgi:hypothetical protein